MSQINYSGHTIGTVTGDLRIAHRSFPETNTQLKSRVQPKSDSNIFYIQRKNSDLFVVVTYG